MNDSKTINKQEKTKVRVALLIGALAIVLMFSSMFAFFSDIVIGKPNMETGSLDIQGQYQMTLNGEAITGLDFDGLAPGDILVISADIENNGNVAAWVRDVVEISMADELEGLVKIYPGVVAAEDIASATEVTLEDGKYESTNSVLNSKLAAGEKIDGVGIEKFVSAFTIYFLEDAGNEAQDKSITLSITTQAIQYRNVATPTKQDWGTVVTAPFGQ